MTARMDRLASATGGRASENVVEDGQSRPPTSKLDASTRGVGRVSAVGAVDGRSVQDAGAAGGQVGARARTGSRARADESDLPRKKRRRPDVDVSTRAARRVAADGAANQRLQVCHPTHPPPPCFPLFLIISIIIVHGLWRQVRVRVAPVAERFKRQPHHWLSFFKILDILGSIPYFLETGFFPRAIVESWFKTNSHNICEPHY